MHPCTEDEGRRGRCCNFPSSPDSDGRAWSPLLRRETAAWLLRNRCTEKTPDLPTKVSSHHQASCGIVDASGRHRHACRIVLGCRTKAGPQLSRREAVPWSPMSTSEQTERPLRFHAPQRPPRRGGTSARGGPEAPRDNLIAVHRLPCDEFGLGPATSVTTALPRRVWTGASHEVSPRRSHPDPDEHLPARSPSGSTPSVGTTSSSRAASERPSGHPGAPRPPS